MNEYKAPLIPEPRTTKGKATLERILLAGDAIFSEHGYVSMRMIDLAEKANLSLGAIYRYFENKDDVFLAVIFNIHKALFDSSKNSSSISFKDDPYTSIYEANLGYLRKYKKHRKLMRTFIEATLISEQYTYMWRYMRDSHISRVLHALEKDFCIPPKKIKNCIEALISMTEQSAFSWYALTSEHEENILSPEEASEVISNIWYKSIFIENNREI